ncbi:hypothetical protein EON79_11525 [bacterium]|nr:MAG: hypothetical protein EON79_11525 [bacterium]
MARDAEMLAAGVAAARVYTWEGPWVTLGRFQRPERSATGAVPYTIRPTGGKAVLHGHDIVVAAAIPVEERAALGDIYRRIVAPLLRAASRCGVRAGFAASRRTETLGADCFAAKGAFDVVDVFGQKIAGCALRVTDRAALLQASIPVGTPLVLPSSAIQGASDDVYLPPFQGDLLAALGDEYSVL